MRGSYVLKLCLGLSSLSFFSLIDERDERSLVMNGHFRKLFPIEFDPGLLESIHKSAVSGVVGATHRVDADNPQRAPGALLILAVTVRVLIRVIDRFVSVTEKAGAISPITFCLFDNALAAFT